MALGMSEYLCDAWLNALCNNTSFAVPTTYVKLHVGDPGTAGTANAAVETTRKAVSWGAPAAPSGGNVVISNDVQVSWDPIAGSEDASHFSLWDDPTAGNYLGSGLITAIAYSAGATYTVAVGGLTLTIPINT